MISFLETLFQIHIYLFGISFEDKCNFDAVNRDDKEASNGKSQDHPNASLTPLTGDIVIGGRRESGWVGQEFIRVIGTYCDNLHHWTAGFIFINYSLFHQLLHEIVTCYIYL